MGSDGQTDPSISLPSGGGAIAAIGETFQADPFTGSATLTLPIVVTAARRQFQPQLTLQYSAGFGNGPFGLGWQLTIPRVTRKTEKGLPRYDADDRFVLSGTEDLVRRLIVTGGGQQPDEITRGAFRVTRYCPRTEGSFARIEQWVDGSDTHWRVTDRQNITSIYGRTPAARLVDPDATSHVFEWLLEESFDAYGNHIAYEYARDAEGLALEGLHEQNRRYAQRYIRRILYGNLNRPLQYPDGTLVGPARRGLDHVDQLSVISRRYALEVLFDYGDLIDQTNGGVTLDPYVAADGPEAFAGPQDARNGLTRPAPLRDDRVSTHRAGFELRSLRRCRRVLMVHHFRELERATVVRSTDLEYAPAALAGLSMLTSVAGRGYRATAGGLLTKQLPPTTLSYTAIDLDRRRYQSLAATAGHLPEHSLADPEFALVDLHGDGLPDVVHGAATGFRVWRNRGGQLMYPKRMAASPAGLALGDPEVAIADLAGDGLADLVVHRQVPGFFESTADGEWSAFRHYHGFPGVALSDPNARFVDLTGDGLADLLITANEHFVWYECLGEAGFAAPRSIERIHNLDAFPDVSFANSDGRVRLADMNGDGLDDIVLVHDGRIDYWPSLGHGRFGPRVTMPASPRFDGPFDPRRVFFADVDGSGCADLIFVESTCVQIWFNQSGNGWSTRQTIHGTPAISDADRLAIADVFGTGTATIVWTFDYAQQPGGNYKALDLCGGQKPHLLAATTNNIGAESRITYAPSTSFYLRDLAEGRPWVTTLPFPVHVVERVELVDRISRAVHVSTYRYHHGYYDGREREFRGFGCVEQIDTEAFDTFAATAAGVQDVAPGFFAPPVLTRTWFHTGAWWDDRALADAFAAEYWAGDPLAATLDPHELPEGPHAHRALRGEPLRREVYGLDDTDRRETPYHVTEYRYRVVEVQPSATEPAAVYLVHRRAMLSHHYERDAADPRIGHEITVAVDAFGNPVASAMIGYPRRIVAANLPEHASTKTLLTLTDYLNHAAAPEWYRAGLIYQTRMFEIANVPPSGPGGTYRAADFQPIVTSINGGGFLPYDAPMPATPAARILEWRRTYFRQDAAAGRLEAPDSAATRLPLGATDRLALTDVDLQAAFTDQQIASAFGDRAPGVPAVDAAMIRRAGYVRDAAVAGYWWIPSARIAYDPQQFFVPIRIRNPFGGTAAMACDDYGLLLVSSTDPENNVTRAVNDYRVLQPREVSSCNGVIASAAFDTLGRPVANATQGGADGDSLAGFVTDPSDAQLAAFIANPRAEALALLGSASTRIIYRLTSAGLDSPPFVAAIAREQHASASATPPVHLVFTYTDGFGRQVQQKVQAEPGAVPARNPATGAIRLVGGQPALTATSTTRWAATGWTIYDNKGAAIQQFEPFFSDTHALDADVRAGHATIALRDPLGREILKIHPDHTYEKVVRTPWMSQSWDRNDTVLQNDPRLDPHVGDFFRRLPASSWSPTWHAARVGGQLGPDEQAVARQTEAHNDTPSTTYVDVFERPVLAISDLGGGRTVPARSAPDLQGNVLSVTDPRGITVRQRFDMAKRVLTLTSPDSGECCALTAIDGKPFWRRDGAGNESVYVFDLSRRATDTWVKPAAAPTFRLDRKTIYGEAKGASATATFHRGEVWKVYDAAGLTESRRYDFKRNLCEGARTVLRDPTATAAWGTAADPFTHVFDEGAAAQQLDTAAPLTGRTAYDALNRQVELETPDGAVQRLSYDEGSRLNALVVQARGAAPLTIVQSAAYNARGDRTRITYGNGVVMETDYDPLTYRLLTQRTRRAGAAAADLQDLSYRYDAIGNVVRARDDAHARVFYANQAVEPECRYVYDAMYRLTEASGRAHQSASGCLYRQTSRKRTRFLDLPQSANNAAAIVNYAERYTYDDSGNLRTIAHLINGAIAWTRDQVFSATSQRLLTSDAGCLRETTPIEYDGNGNITRLPHLPGIVWDAFNAPVGLQLNAGTNPDVAQYRYDAAGARVRKTITRQNHSQQDDRIYVGGYERFTRRDPTGILEWWNVLSVADGQRRIATIETKVDPADGVTVVDRLVRYSFGDARNAAITEVDESAAARLVSYEEYSPFGSSTYLAGESLAAVRRKRYRFAGKECDDESGLYYFGSRYLAPWLGRWISCDPAGFADGLNPYAYVRNNPLTFVDPDGRQSRELGPVASQAQGMAVMEANEYNGEPLGNSELALMRDPATGKWTLWIGRSGGVLPPSGLELWAHSHQSAEGWPSNEDLIEVARRGQRTFFFYQPERGWQVYEYDAAEGRFTQTNFETDGRVRMRTFSHDATGGTRMASQMWDYGEFKDVGTHEGVTGQHLADAYEMSQRPGFSFSVGEGIRRLSPQDLARLQRVSGVTGGILRGLTVLGAIASLSKIADSYKLDLMKERISGVQTYSHTTKRIATESSGWACAGAVAGPSAEGGGLVGGAIVGFFGGGPLGAAIGAVVGAGLFGLGGSVVAFKTCEAASGGAIDNVRKATE